MSKRMIIMLVTVGVILALVFGYKSFEGVMVKKYLANAGKQAQTVSTTTANYSDWHSSLEAVGSLIAIQGVDVSSEVSGVVEDSYFNSGDYVEVGTLLVKLRADDDVAALNSLRADARLAELTYRRDFKQLQEKTIAQSVFDTSKANLEKALALVSEQEAKIAKKYIRAPFSGRLGISNIDLGQYLSPGESIVTLQKLDPIYFDFYLPQQNLSQIKIGQKITLTTDRYPDKKYQGFIHAINSKVEENTRNVKVQGTFPNKDFELIPGMYAVIRIDLGETNKYITIPNTSITYNPYGDTVFVVKEDSTVEQRFVTLGPTRGDEVAILKGVDEGQTIVTAGQLKLQNGTTVKVNNEVLPTDNPAPIVQEQ